MRTGSSRSMIRMAGFSKIGYPPSTRRREPDCHHRTNSSPSVSRMVGSAVPIHGQETRLRPPGNYYDYDLPRPVRTLWSAPSGAVQVCPANLRCRLGKARLTLQLLLFRTITRAISGWAGRVPGITRFRIRDGHVTHLRRKGRLFDDFRPAFFLTTGTISGSAPQTESNVTTGKI